MEDWKDPRDGQEIKVGKRVLTWFALVLGGYVIIRLGISLL